MQEALLADAADPANDAQVALRDALPLIEPPNNAPIILPCGDFSSTLIHSTSASFDVEIRCPTAAIARCIVWIVRWEAGKDVNAVDLETKANFWSYSNEHIVQQDGVTASMFVKDAGAVSDGESCERVISFSNLPTNPGRRWGARCSYTGDTGVCTLIFNDKLRQFPITIIEMYPIQSTLEQVQQALAANPVTIGHRALIAALPPIVKPENAPIIPYCGAFSSTLINPTPKSFGVEINCPTDAVARCIAWIANPEEGEVVNVADLEINANFWSYSNNDIVPQVDVTAPQADATASQADVTAPQADATTPIIVKDAAKRLKRPSCRRVIRFLDLPTNPRKWDVRCSYTGNTGVCTVIFNDKLRQSHDNH